MKNLKLLVLATLSLVFFISCNDDNEYGGTAELNYVSFEADSYAFGVDLGSSNTRDIKIYSTKVSGSARTINIMVDTEASSADPASYEVPATVTIPANSNEGVLSVTVSDVNISKGGESLVLEFSVSDELFIGEAITINIKQVCPLNELFLNITFDGWPEEIYWVLEDDLANVVAESAPGAYGAYAGLTGGVTESFCLAGGDYVFTIYDQYGDGAGAFSLTLDGNTLFESDGSYGAGTVANLSF